jgi:hypothetical protein
MPGCVRDNGKRADEQRAHSRAILKITNPFPELIGSRR